MIKTRHQKGFTIVELMISTVVFAIVLLICLSGIMRITGLYYKGVNTARIQQTARSVMDEVSQSIQFSVTGVNATPGGETRYAAANPNAFNFICVGTKRYTYVIDGKRSDNNAAVTKQIKHALWVDEPTGGCVGVAGIGPAKMDDDNPSTAAVPVGTNGREMLDLNMRVTNFSVQPVGGTTGLWTVSISLAYGDEDLLEPLPGATGGGRRECLSVAGSQFCALGELQTTVQRRVL